MNRAHVDKKESGVSGAVVVTAGDIDTLVERRDISPMAFAVWVKQLLQSWRQGTVGVKDRSEVNLTGKKPWKQKGTGRARAGTPRSPIWRKGGVIHGPQPRVRELKVAKKQKSGVLNALLWRFVDKAAIHVLSHSIDRERPHTASARQLLHAVDLHTKKIVLFLQPLDTLNCLSFVNLSNVRIVYFDEVNAFDLASADCWLVLHKDLETFKQTVAQWN